MIMKEQLLEKGVNNPLIVSPAVTKSPIGYVFNLNNLGFINGSPAAQSGFNNLVLSGLPFMLPIQSNWSGNLFINIQYQTIDGGSAWTADPRFVFAPCTLDGEIIISQGSDWNLGVTLPNTTYAVMAETFGQKIIGTTGQGTSAGLQFSSQMLINNPVSNTLNQGALYGNFRFGFYYDNYTNAHSGDTWFVNTIHMLLPYSSGVRI